MTTVLSKAQKLIQKIRSNRHDIEDWPKDSLDAFLDLEQAIAQEQAVLEPESCSTCGNNEAPFAKCDVCTVQYDSDEVSNWEPNP